MSKLEGFCVGLVLLALIAACLYFGGEQHGSTEERAAVLKAGESARSAAEKTTVDWQAAALAALKARDNDRSVLNSTHFVDSPVVTPAIVPGGMLKHSPATRVPANTATAARTAATPSGCPENLVQSTSNELQREFDAAKRYDELALDYKELYDSWPQSSAPAAHH